MQNRSTLSEWLVPNFIKLVRGTLGQRIPRQEDQDQLVFSEETPSLISNVGIALESCLLPDSK